LYCIDDFDDENGTAFDCVCVWRTPAARPSDTEMPGLCSDAELRRNEWPWIGESE